MNTKRITGLLILSMIVAVAVYYFYPYKKMDDQVVIDKLVVLKSRNQLYAFAQGKLVRTYKIAIGGSPQNDKQYEGDRRTPEGQYIIHAKNPNSAYHKNLGISYPNAADLLEAKALGKPAGGDIKIHGLKNGRGYIGRFHRWMNWTNGCIALTTEDMDDLSVHTPVGTPIIINP